MKPMGIFLIVDPKPWQKKKKHQLLKSQIPPKKFIFLWIVQSSEIVLSKRPAIFLTYLFFHTKPLRPIQIMQSLPHHNQHIKHKHVYVCVCMYMCICCMCVSPTEIFICNKKYLKFCYTQTLNLTKKKGYHYQQSITVSSIHKEELTWLAIAMLSTSVLSTATSMSTLALAMPAIWVRRCRLY